MVHHVDLSDPAQCKNSINSLHEISHMYKVTTVSHNLISYY
jgi:hypothetical protein